MSAGHYGGAFEPFFLPASPGERFCIFHRPAPPARGAVLYVHPFAEEMNKSRRMAALQARTLAARGFAVLQLDLFGCGDSSGDFGDATWETWRDDVALGARWLERQAGRGVTLWSLRVGALLALDSARGLDSPPVRFVLWQPVISGEQFVTQFLRLRVASEMLSAGAAKSDTRSLRDTLNAGGHVEIAGYNLSPAIATALDRLKLADLAPNSIPVHWLEVVAEPGRTLPPAAQSTADRWSSRGARLEVRCLPGAPFWNTPEITECPALVSATTELFDVRR